MRRFVTYREFFEFKDLTESGMIKLKLEGGEVQQELRELRCEFDEFKSDTLGHLDRITGIVEGIAQEQLFSNKALERLEAGQVELKQDVSGLKQDVSSLKQDVSSLKENVEMILKKL